MPSRSANFSSAIYSDLPLDKIYLPEQLLAANSWCEPSLNDLQVGDEVEVWSADGTAYKGILVADADECFVWRKLLAEIISARVYSTPDLLLANLTDNELESLLIFRGLNR